MKQNNTKKALYSDLYNERHTLTKSLPKLRRAIKKEKTYESAEIFCRAKNRIAELDYICGCGLPIIRRRRTPSFSYGDIRR